MHGMQSGGLSEIFIFDDISPRCATAEHSAHSVPLHYTVCQHITMECISVYESE